jgi:hypothetical protein
MISNVETPISDAAEETATTHDAIRRMGVSTPAPDFNWELQGNGAAGDPPTTQSRESTVHETPAAPHANGGAAAPPYQGLSERQLREANGRRLLLLAALPLLAEGVSVTKTAAACGVKNSAMHRLLTSAPAHGAERINAAEKCRRLLALPVERLTPVASEGRGSPFDALLLVPEIVSEMHRLYAATMGASCAQATNDRRTGSVATTLKRLGDFPTVPPHLAQKLSAGAKPSCLVRFVKRHWTPELEAKFRGQKHYNASTICGRRELTEELTDGSCVPLQPGRVWVFDDMSSNLPFWFEVDGLAGTLAPPEMGLRPLIERHGCALGRQGLYAWDWASGAWLGLELVGRFQDAYQASDILRFIRKLVQQYGKPDKIVLERGVWQARAISGWKIEDGDSGNSSFREVEDACEFPEMAGNETARIHDGLRAIGVEIIHTYTPRGKPIEGAFNYLQRLVPTFLKPGEAVNIGRHAGEFEWSAKQMRRGQDGVQHPRDLGFIHIDRLADVSWEAMKWDGAHDKENRNGKPLEILATYLGASPLPPASGRDLAVFLPDKRNQILRGGTITAQVNGDAHQFLNPEVFAALGDGVRLDYAFDPAEPTLGAAIYGDKGFLCWADYLPAGPVISARDRSEDIGPQLIKRYKLAHRTAARLLDLKSLRTVKFSEVRSPKSEVQNTNGGPAGAPVQRHSLLKPATPDEFRRRSKQLSEQAGQSRRLQQMTPVEA